MEEFDVIVVGAGIEGSATAYTLAKGNSKTLLLEQFLLPHTRGSSHGQSRIIRKAYDKKFYAEMMNDAFRLWHELETETATNLFKRTGLLVAGRPPHGSAHVNNTEKALASQNVVFQKLNSRQMNEQFPMMRFAEGDHGVYEAEAGMLKADKALACYHKMFVHYGGVLRDGEPVTKVIPGEHVTIETSKQRYKARSVVLTVGPWAPKMLKTLGLDLPLQPVRINVCYWKQLDQMSRFDQQYPSVYMQIAEGQSGCYSVPSDEYPGLLKVCAHFGVDIDPDYRDTVHSDQDLKVVTDFVKDIFPYLEPKPSIIETCIYTMTPDTDYILDHHPHHRNIVIGAGFSGHGFKLSPVVGQILTDLALHRRPSRDLGLVALGRFTGTAYEAKL